MSEISALWTRIHLLTRLGVILGMLTGGFYTFFSLGFASGGSFNPFRIIRACIVPGIILLFAVIAPKWPKSAGLCLIVPFLVLSIFYPPELPFLLPPVAAGSLILGGALLQQRQEVPFDKGMEMRVESTEKKVALEPDNLVLLHGLGRGPRSLWLLERRLRREGYEIRNLGYPSTRRTVEELADTVRARILAACPDRERKIHFVTVSMGGIIVRHIMANAPLPNIGRVVMLVPPNSGSELADFLMDRWIYRKLMGPAGQQLGTDDSSAPNSLPPADFGPGVIAGDFSVLPFFSLVIPGRDDGMVSVQRTKVEGMTDWVVIRTSHTFVMYNREAARQAAHFLRHGRFDKKQKRQSLSTK